ncbi:hypothetical protein ACFL35_00085 [Candidatus Riflebacteria bacterium]
MSLKLQSIILVFLQFLGLGIYFSWILNQRSLLNQALVQEALKKSLSPEKILSIPLLREKIGFAPLRMSFFESYYDDNYFLLRCQILPEKGKRKERVEVYFFFKKNGNKKSCGLVYEKARLVMSENRYLEIIP